METALDLYGLDKNPDMEIVEYNSDEEWLAERKKGIGGSDAAAVLGMNKYKSPLQLYKTKEGEVSEDLSDNVFVRKGKDLEALIRNVYVKPFVESMGYRLHHPDFMFVNKRVPWLRANCDGIAVPVDMTSKYTDNLVIEIKWVSEYGENNWYKDEYNGVPPEYYAQVQHYMLVTGARNAYVCAMFDKDWRFETFHIPFDLSFAAKLKEATQKFYEYHMQMHIPPKPDPELDKEDFAETVKKVPTVTATMCCSSAAFDTKLGEYIVQKETAKAHTDIANNLLKEIKDMYVNDGYRSSLYSVSITTSARRSFDTVEFAKDHPELYSQYLKNVDTVYTTIRRK